MKRIMMICAAMLGIAAYVSAERVEPIPFGDFETWTVRYIKESKIIGGKTKTLFVPAPTDTIWENKVYKYGQRGSQWTTSNAYAKIMGIEKGSMSTVPEKRGNGTCCYMFCRVDDVTALGIDLKVLVAGSVFLGKTNEPVTMANSKDPYSTIDMGVPFKGHPIALELDYKAKVSPSTEITYAKATAHPKKIQGQHDEAEIYVYLQHRWEDAEGKIHAHRVATGYERITKDVPDWVNNHRVPIRWGDITKQPNYKDYEGLTSRFKGRNSKGQMTYILEEGYSNEEPTHIVVMLTAGRFEAFIGHEGNALWVDNVKLVYAK